MKLSANKLVLIFLALALVGILAALVRETGKNPTFRASDYATLEECLRNIPREWAPGSVDYLRAEAGCRYEHAQVEPAGP